MAVFDRLPYGARELDGQDLRRRPIEDRKAALERLIRRKLPQGTDWLNTFEIDDGALVFEQACALGCEGA